MTKIERYNSLDDLSQKLNAIFYELIDLDEISYYRYALVSQKTLLITQKVQLIFDEFSNQNKILKEKIEKMDKIRAVINLILIFLALITPYLALPLSFIPLIMAYKTDKLSKEIINVDETEEYTKKLKEMQTTVENINTFASAKHQKSIVGTDEICIDENRDYYLAHSLIAYYLTSDIPLMMPNRINKIVIDILQSDLQTDISDLKELICLARQKLEEESIKEDLCLERTKKGL